VTEVICIFGLNDVSYIHIYMQFVKDEMKQTEMATGLGGHSIYLKINWTNFQSDCSQAICQLLVSTH